MMILKLHHSNLPRVKLMSKDFQIFYIRTSTPDHQVLITWNININNNNYIQEYILFLSILFLLYLCIFFIQNRKCLIFCSTLYLLYWLEIFRYLCAFNFVILLYNDTFCRYHSNLKKLIHNINFISLYWFFYYFCRIKYEIFRSW